MMRIGRRGFTMVEVLVVIGLIALLVGLLVPAVAMARKSSMATASQSNLKQWGSATINYTSTHKERLPWEGLPNLADMETNLAEKTYWANAVAVLAGVKPYSEMVSLYNSGQEEIPIAPQTSVWCDPAGITDVDGPWSFPNGACFFSYVPNMRLNDSQATNAVPEPKKVITMAMIPDSSGTVLMTEMRSRASELPPTDYYAGEQLQRNQSDWRTFPTRHFEGGHVVFADGHVSHVLNDVATRSATGNRDPNQALGDWNKPKLIWNPQGQAPYTLP